MIALPDTIATRPTKSIVKESLFDTLGSEVRGAAFVEAFAGSGSVGFEAISRGADHALFIERDQAAISVLKANIAALKIQNAQIISGDSFTVISEAVRLLQTVGDQAWFYIDPPFHFRAGQTEIYTKTEAMITALPASCVRGIVIEHSADHAFAQTIGAYALIKRRVFGKTALSYYLPQ